MSELNEDNNIEEAPDLSTSTLSSSETDHPSSPIRSSPKESDGYIVRKWGGLLKNANAERGEETEFTEEKLAVLRRLCDKMERTRVKAEVLNSRKHERRTFADIVQIIPLDPAGQPDFSRRMVSFCRNISAGGCAMLHTRLLQMKELVIFFPHLADGSGRHAAIQGKIIRDRPLSLGMYELAIQFQKLVNLDDDDLRILLAASKTSRRN